MKRLSVPLDCDTHRRLRLVAVQRGVSVAAIVRRLVADDLARVDALPVGADPCPARSKR